MIQAKLISCSLLSSSGISLYTLPTESPALPHPQWAKKGTVREKETVLVLLLVARKSFSEFSRLLTILSATKTLWAANTDILKVNMGIFHLRDATVRQQILI